MPPNDHLSLDGIDQIPDPVGCTVPPAPAAPAAEPPLPALPPSPTRAERRTRVIAACMFAAGWAVTVLSLTGIRGDIAAPVTLVPMAAWIACGAVILAIVLRPRERGLPAGVRAVQHALWLVPAVFVAGVALVATSQDLPLGWATMKGCVAISAAMTLGPLSAAAYALRGTFLAAAGWRGAAVGALAGLMGSVGVHAHCPVDGLRHLLFAHGAAILLGAAAGGALGHLRGRA